MMVMKMSTKENDLLATLKDHEKRIIALEGTKSKSTERRQTKDKVSLTDHIMDLRDQGFFSPSKTAIETHGKLKSKYECAEDRVAMALLRLAGRKKLRKTTKSIGGKKYKSYVW